ncbi:hypothetical protein GCM10027277_28140 [Pseudoduganella ginsengisoli]
MRSAVPQGNGDTALELPKKQAIACWNIPDTLPVKLAKAGVASMSEQAYLDRCEIEHIKGCLR